LSSFGGFAVFLTSFIAATILLVVLLWRMRKDFIKEQSDIRITRAIADGTLSLRESDEQNAQNADKWAEAQYLLENGLSGAEVIKRVNGGDFLLGQIEKQNELSVASNQTDGDLQTDGNDEEIQDAKPKKSAMHPVTKLTLPDDFTRDFGERGRAQKQLFLYVTIAAGVVCAVLSLIWGLIK
jgi:hypothetical protein